MSLADVTSARSSPAPPCPDCDATASVTSDLHKYQVACTCKPGSAQYACADEPGPPPPAKTDTPPALPPRPAANTLAATNRRNNSAVGCNGQDTSCRRRKYAWWCVGCGALAAALGGLLAAQHILVRAYTASPHHLETVPAAVPAAMLVLTGVCIMSLARRRNRYSYMIKVVGACCLMCALTCVLVTITTTVIHMNKLQTLKFCEYTKLTRTCTCFSMPPDAQHNNDDDGVRCVFEGVSECGVVHGALYWCLRGVFALSVTAVLVCIFSCMLAYQLLSHERKKMYWEQLELRCRSLYRPPSGQAPPTGRPVQSNCSCCTQCHPSQPAWDISLQHRFWAPGRIGNLYSPNPGAGRKNSAWSWFPWPRSNSQNSRCRMNVPQSGDSAYGFCETDVPAAPYDRTYPGNYPPGQAYPDNQGSFHTQATFTPTPSNYPPGQNYPLPQGNYPQGQNYPNYQEGFGESSGSFDAQTGVWGPPPPYSPQGRSGSRHHLHQQDPATATLLHHHHIDPHTHTNIHTCSRNYTHNLPDTRPDMTRADVNRADVSRADLNRSDIIRADINRSDVIRADLNRSDIIRADLNRPDMIRADLNRSEIMRSTELLRTNDLNREMMRVNQELIRNPDMIRGNPELLRANPDLLRANPDLLRANPDLLRANDMGHIMQYPDDMPMDGRFNTLRGHLVPYRCQRIGMSASNLHRDCRMDDNVTIECLHQKSASKISDQSSDSQKQGKENLGFQNDKHSPIRSSMQDCRVNQNAESEVYFADVSSCCNVSVKAECCMNPTVSALVGTIENHPESTSESDTGSFTLTRSQRPQPQVGSKRRPKHTHKTDKHAHKVDKHTHKTLDKRHPNSSVRLTEHQIEQLNIRMNDPRMDRNEMRMSERNDSRDRLNDSRMINDARIERIDSRDRLNDPRSELDRMNDSRISDRMNETRLSERMTDRMSDRFERLNESRISERMNDSRLDRLNDSRMDRMNDSRISDRMNETRVSERLNESRINRLNESDRSGDRTNESRHSDRLNETRMSDRLNETRMSDRLNETRISDRLNDTRMSDRMDRMSDLNSSIRNEGSPKMRSHISPLRMPRLSPKIPKDSETKPDFFVPPPPAISPLSPNTEESLLSDDDRPRDKVYSNDPETSKCLAPDSQYENKEKEILKANHHHCYSDTNTMDSGWQSGSEKQVTD